MIPLRPTYGVKFKDKKQNSDCQGLEEGEKGNYGVMGTEFQYGKTKNSGDGWW